MFTDDKKNHADQCVFSELNHLQLIKQKPDNKWE